MIGMVTDIVGLIIVKEAVGTIVDGDTQNRHVIGVHHAVSKADGLPMGDEPGGAFDHIGKPQQIAITLIFKLRPVAGNHKISQLLHLLRLLTVIKMFEMAETHVAFRYA
ncbi:hypothetical protein D3C81_692520 [compost metagenome]